MIIGFDASRAFVSEPTGTENYSFQLLKALSQIDKKNTYRVYLASQGLTPSGLSLRVEDLRGWPENFQFKVINWPRLWTQGGLALECLLNPPDVLFIPAHTLPVIRRPNLKTVVTIHDLGAEYLPQYHQFPQKYYLNWATIYAVKNAARIIAVSQNTSKDLITKLHCDIQVIRVIGEGVDVDKFKIPAFAEASAGKQNSKIEQVLRRYNIPKPYILFVGTIQPRKNLVRLIEAFAQITSRSVNQKTQSVSKSAVQKNQTIRESDISELPKHRFTELSGLTLVLVGKPGWMYEEIYAVPKRLGLSDKVKFLNFVSDQDLAILYKEASVFCLPSLYEGFGLPVLEAMAAGVPVVASKTSSLPEIVGDSGVLVDPYDAHDIAQGLKKILQNQKLRETLIKKGKERVEKFSWVKTARQTLKVLEEACSN
ncbi:glycosyltransferase family 4 protein [Candidatus Microgenomates bacterium]|nr:glycosyltransferase family 4 protein [Candidatus Microgenomates bacterium]